MAGEKVEEQDAPEAPTSSTTSASIDSNPFFIESSKRLKKLPPLLDHFNSRDLKVLFKCCAAAWIYTLFMLINPTLRTIGQATFFGVLVLFIVPPSGVVFTSIMAGTTIVVGICLGWAWGTITMKAALATRPAADLQAQLQRIAQSRNTTNNVQASGQAEYTQIAIYNGATLDTRVSVTYFCMIGLFIYLVSRIRVAAPKLALIQMFATIISDIYLTIAPLIPTFQGTIPRVLILPAVIGFGVGIVCNIIFFPRSTSHIVLDGMQSVLAPMATFLEANLLNFQNPVRHMELGRLKQTKAQVVGGFKAMEANLAFLALDASMGRWGADDVRSLHTPLRNVLITFFGLIQTHISRAEFRSRDKQLEEVAALIDPEEHDDTKVKAGQQHLAKIYDYRQRSRHPDDQRLLEDSLRALASAGSDLIQAEQEALATIIKGLRISNSRRWFRRPTPQEIEQNCAQHAGVLSNLQQHRAAFSGKTAKDLWAKHKHMFDADGKLIVQQDDQYNPPTGGIMLSLVLEERLAELAQALEVMLTQLVELEQKRQRVRLWLPGNLQNFLPWALEKDSGSNVPSGKAVSISSSSDEDDIDGNTPSSTSDSKSKAKSTSEPVKSKKKKKKKAPLDPNTAAYQMERMKVRGVERRSAGGRFLIGAARWFTNTEGLFALRVLVATIAVGVVAVIPRTAGFFYREKGLWALIMAQTALLPYTADFIASFFMRMGGTLIGAVVGLACWYIGSGNGPGNPYGMAAIMVPVVVFFMWLRLFGNPALLQGILLAAVTTYLVWSYSWVDTHIPNYGNPGVGYNVFWRRMLLVIIGFGVAAIVTFFPRPPSASRHYRRLLSESLQTNKSQYGLLSLNMSADPSFRPMDDLKPVVEKTALANAEVLLSIEPTIKLLRFEFSTSNFDAASLGHVCRLCINVNQSLTQLLLYATQLPPPTRARFLRVTGAADDALAADVHAVLTLVQQALRSGDPLPAVMPTPLIVRSMEGARRRVVGTEHHVRMSEPILAQPATRKYCAAMGAWVQFLSNVDELVIVVKRRVGETGWVGTGRAAPADLGESGRAGGTTGTREPDRVVEEVKGPDVVDGKNS